MAKAKRAASGALDKIARINKVVENTKTYTEAAKLLGISRRSLYNYRMAHAGKIPAKSIMARKSTVIKYESKLQEAATRVITKQVQHKVEGTKPTRSSKQAAEIISAGTGEKWSYQRVSSLVRRFAKSEPELEKEKPTIGWVADPDELDEPVWADEDILRASDIEKFTRKDYDAGLTKQYTSDGTKDGVRFVKKGYTWLNEDGSPRGLIIRRDKVCQTEEEAIDWITQVSNSKYVLVVEINIDINGNEYYEIWLDSDSV